MIYPSVKHSATERALYILLTVLLAACSADDAALQQQGQQGTLRLTTSVNGFDGDDEAPVTRTDVAGTRFATGDWMKLKIICPFVDHVNFGETTYGNTFDGLWLLKWGGSEWTPITSDDKVDVGADYAYSGAYSLFGRYEAQQTPYVYTASTWNENVLFLANGTLYSQYSYIFHADQSKEADYLKCDLLWAQNYMQTGSYNVHLAFDHVMACLKIDLTALGLSSNAIVTLEGMPDIDQREVVVGDYYAARSKINSGYGYQQKCSCSKADNGRVLGVTYINESTREAQVFPMTGNPNPNSRTPVANTGTYKAYNAGSGIYRLIVPPCTLTTPPTVWIRDGETRYSYTLASTTSFEQGKLYTVNVLLTPPAPDPDDDEP